jgi:hypothetical protein
MAKYRKTIPKRIKDSLLKEAGDKCANPGCHNLRVHFHHIKEWAIYETNDEQMMIAVCPKCHDDIHHGRLPIDDDTLFRWKNATRKRTNRDLFYVEPGATTKLLLGSFSVEGDTGLKVFDLSPQNQLSFRILEQDIFLVNLIITTTSGKEIIRIAENHIKFCLDPSVYYDNITGHKRITVPLSSDFLPMWAASQILGVEENYSDNGRIVYLDIEVVEPGLVRIQGIWPERRHCIIITKNALHFISPSHLRPVTIVGAGPETILHWNGPIDKAMFGFIQGKPRVAPDI